MSIGYASCRVVCTYACVFCCTHRCTLQDGEAEILVGTFDARLLVYRATSSTEDGLPQYTLVLERRFMYPVYSIQVGDFNGVRFSILHSHSRIGRMCSSVWWVFHRMVWMRSSL